MADPEHHGPPLSLPVLLLGRIADGPAEQRVALARQRQGLMRMRERLEECRPAQARALAAAAQSRSHCRGLAGTLHAAPDDLGVGFDLEWASPQRRWQRILQHFLPDYTAPTTRPQLAATWCFGEAFFKALGRNPEPALLERFLDAFQGSGTVLGLSMGTASSQQSLIVGTWEILPDFWMAAVRIRPPARSGRPVVRPLEGIIAWDLPELGMSDIPVHAMASDHAPAAAPA